MTSDSEMTPSPRPGGEKLHGRRKGRPLRPAQQRALTDLAPRMSLSAPNADGCIDPAAAFDAPVQEVWLEIGFGGGEHLVEQARRNPQTGLIGAEVFQDGVAKMLRAVEDAGLTNVRLYQDDARDLLEALPEASLDKVFILFPDPWPKTKHHKRRIVQKNYLDLVARILKDGGELRLATDDPSYQQWMLIELTRHPAFAWTARRPADWRERPDDWPPTRYEGKAIDAGRTPMFLRYRRKARVEADANT